MASILVPSITAALISPNPATASTSILLSFTIDEISVEVLPFYYYSGDIYSGEV